MIGAIVCFVMAINFGGAVYAWNSGTEIALFVVAGVLFLAFGVQQGLSLGTTKERRIFPVTFLTSRDYARTSVLMFCCAAAGGATIFVPVYFIPLFFQFTRGDTAIEAAVRLLPFILVMVFVTITQGVLLSHPSGRFSLYIVWYLAGGACTLVGGTLMYLIDAKTSEAWVYGSSALVGVGAGMAGQAAFSIAVSYVTTEE